MKKVVNTLMLVSYLVVLATSTGLTMFYHYCYHRQTGYVSFIDNKTCDRDEAVMPSNIHGCSSCCTTDDRHGMKFAEHCCSNQMILYRLTDEYSRPETMRTVYQVAMLSTPVQVLPEDNEVCTNEILFPSDKAPPAPSGRELVFLIHQPKIPLPS